MNKKLTPLELLRQEKRYLKKGYKADEQRLQKNWDYLSNNMGGLFFNTGLNGIKSVLGLKKEEPKVAQPEENSLLHTLSSSFPVIWEIAQPMLISMAVKRVKRMFSSKKKDS